MVKDINPGVEGSSPMGLTNINDELFFEAYTPETGEELWSSDGSLTGTVLIQDINPGLDGSFPSWFTLSGNLIFFYAMDGSHGFELWALPAPLPPLHKVFLPTVIQ